MDWLHSDASRLLGILLLSLSAALPESAAQDHADRDRIVPIKQLADRLTSVLTERSLQHCDSVPSIRVAGLNGYRIVLRRVWKDINPEDIPQQTEPAGIAPPARFKLRNDDWEFVLFPQSAGPAPASLAQQIPWKKNASLYHTRDVCLGEGYGYFWFTHHTIPNQNTLRKKMQLKAGDDPVRLLVAGLAVEDFGAFTANSCCIAVADHGDDAVELIRNLLQTDVDPWKPIYGLGHIQTPGATKLLLQQFDSDDEKRSQAAAYALISQLPDRNVTPYRRDAKQAYLEMLRKRIYADAAASACVHFEWTEALPLIRLIEQNPESRIELRSMVHKRRVLAGNPIADEILAAELVLRGAVRRDNAAESAREFNAARRLMTETKDSEAALTTGLWLALFTSKGSAERVQSTGIDILRDRPRRETVTFLTTVAVNAQKPFRNQVRSVLQQIDPKAATACIGTGPAVRGLQATIRFENAQNVDTLAISYGNQLSLNILVKNVSQNPISFFTYSPSFRAPNVVAGDGRRMRVSTPVYNGPVQLNEHKLASGQSVTLPLLNLKVVANSPTGGEDYCLFSDTGVHNISYVLRLDSSQKHDWKGELMTGDLTLNVQSPNFPFAPPTRPRPN